jgi:hypothetical protein
MNSKQALLGALLTVFSAYTTLSCAATATPAAAPSNAFDSAVVSGLGARNIGSAVMSGRIAALAARQEKDGKVTVYVGAASGGVWKSLDGGTTFKPVFDKQPVQSIGAIALDPGDPNTVGRHGVRAGRATRCRSETASIVPPTRANPGTTWVCRNPST